MSDETASPQPSGNARLADLERTAEDIRQKIGALVEQQRAGRVQLVVATIVILAIVTGFCFMLYGRMRENFSSANLQRVVEARHKQLLDDAKRALEQAADELLPLYQEKALERAKTVFPKLMEQAELELVGLPEEIQADIESRLDNSMETVRTNALQELEKTFPFLGDHTKSVTAMEYFKDHMVKHGEEFQSKMAEIMADEQMRVNNVLKKFAAGDVSKVEKAELTKNLIKTALLYALYETEVSGSDEDLHTTPMSMK